jgi:Flp pilus assembly pilin Flp
LSFISKEIDINNLIEEFFQDEQGASAAEYAMLVAVIAAVLLGGMLLFYGCLGIQMIGNVNKINST